MKMVGTSTPKILIFSVKSSSSSTLIFVKFKTLVHTLIFSHLCRVARAISRAKSAVVQILKENYQAPAVMGFKKNKNKNKIFFGSFRLHYNWCSSSHVMPMPVPEPVFEGHFYYDSTWNSLEGGGAAAVDSPQLSGYLQWLEERKFVGGNNSGVPASEAAEMNEIDKLAEMFIASCHEKFRLEKQESYRRFQEMMARSM